MNFKDNKLVFNKILVGVILDEKGLIVLYCVMFYSLLICKIKKC